MNDGQMNQFDTGALGRCFFPPDRAGMPDVVIVFGMSAPHRPVERAASLFHAGRVPLLLFSGGYNPRLGRPEAHAMADLALAQGIPAQAILIEDRARNTQENIEFSHHLLEQRFGPAGPHGVMLLTIHYHLRRACLAARSRLPAEIDLCWTCYPSHYYTADNWFAVERGRHDVMSELRKIESYYDLAPADLLRLEA